MGQAEINETEADVAQNYQDIKDLEATLAAKENELVPYRIHSIPTQHLCG